MKSVEMVLLSKMGNVAATVASEKIKDEITGVRSEPLEQVRNRKILIRHSVPILGQRALNILANHPRYQPLDEQCLVEERNCTCTNENKSKQLKIKDTKPKPLNEIREKMKLAKEDYEKNKAYHQRIVRYSLQLVIHGPKPDRARTNQMLKISDQFGRDGPN